MDLISRHAATTVPVMPKEHRHYQTSNLDDAYEQGWYDLQECIEQLPSAQPERKRGRWTKVTDRYGINGESVWRCSSCLEMTICKGDYCPNCGADMRGEEHDL